MEQGKTQFWSLMARQKNAIAGGPPGLLRTVQIAGRQEIIFNGQQIVRIL